MRQKISTVHPSICQPPICQQNPICQQFFGNEKLTNWVREGFQKTKAKFVSHDDLLYAWGCKEWDSKEWDSLPPIGATLEILEIRIEWDK